MYIMCLIIFEEKAEVQDQDPLSMNPVQIADDPIQDRNRSIVFEKLSKVYFDNTQVDFAVSYEVVFPTK